MPRRSLWVVFGLCVLPTAWVCAALVHKGSYTLERLPHLQSSKLTLERGLMGAVAFASTPMALHGDRLNLGAWHGFQEVLTRESIQPRSLRFRMRLADAGVLTIVYGKGPGGFSGLRLSRNANFGTLRFRADPEGRFLTTEPLPAIALGADWMDCSIRFGEGSIAISIDGREVSRYREDSRIDGRLGFRAGLSEVFIDDLEIDAAEGGLGLRESFDSGGPSIRSVALAWAAIGAALMWLARGPLRGRSSSSLRERDHFYYSMAFNLSFLLVSFLLLTTERSILSGRHGYSALYFDASTWVRDYDSYYVPTKQVLAGLRQEQADRIPTERPRVFFVGTSQTWGAGASRRDFDLVSRIESALDQFGTPAECVNAGLSGKNAAYLFRHYSQEWVDWDPDMVVLNLGTNDVDAGELRVHLEKFVELNRSRGVSTVMVLEPNHIDTPIATLPEMHAVIREVARRNELPVIDLHATLLARKDDGLLWWDFVHLSDFGQRLAADSIAGELTSLLAPENDAATRRVQAPEFRQPS